MSKKSKTKEIDPILGEIPEDLIEDSEESLPTIKELGHVLPIGFKDNTNLIHKDFSFKEYTWELEEELGEIKEKEPDLEMGPYISEILCHSLINIGDIKINEMKENYKKRALLRSLYYADVLYMYVCLRIDSLGHELAMNPFKCKCGNTVKYIGDLRTLGVKIPENTIKKIKLKDGMTYATKNLKNITVGPLKWSFMETKDNNIFNNKAKTILEVIRNSVISIEGAPEGPVFITSGHLRSMKPREVLQLYNKIDQINAGVSLVIEGECGCKRKFYEAIDWRYENFFDPSSL